MHIIIFYLHTESLPTVFLRSSLFFGPQIFLPIF